MPIATGAPAALAAKRRAFFQLCRHLVEETSTRRSMAFVLLKGDELLLVFSLLCDVFEPHVAIAFSNVNRELRSLTQAARQQLMNHRRAMMALCLQAGLGSWKEVRESREAPNWWYRCHISGTARSREIRSLQAGEPHRQKWLSAVELAALDPLGPLRAELSALEQLCVFEQPSLPHESPRAADSCDGMLRLAAVVGAGALPALTTLTIVGLHVGDAGATALGAALGQGASSRLTAVFLASCGIGDAGLMALAPTLRQLSGLTRLSLAGNPFGDEGVAALVAPPPPAGPLALLTGVPSDDARTYSDTVLFSLKKLYLSQTRITDRGCAALARALDRCALLQLDELALQDVPAGAAAKAEVQSFLE